MDARTEANIYGVAMIALVVLYLSTGIGPFVYLFFGY
jgi:hypothetical protein